MINLLFDLDETLCRCSVYYTEALHRYATLVAESYDLPFDFVLHVAQRIDLEATKLPRAFDKMRFPRSLVAAGAACAHIAERPFDLERQILQIGWDVFDAPYPLYPQVEPTLQSYADSPHYELYLYTMGDPEVQWRKIHRNNLTRFFAPERILVTPHKTPEALTHAVQTHWQLDPRECIVIGDSVRSDIGPALANGIPCIQVMGQTWDYDQAEHKATAIVNNIAELPEILLPHEPTCLVCRNLGYTVDHHIEPERFDQLTLMRCAQCSPTGVA